MQPVGNSRARPARGSSARCENRAHDFPQRIEYRRAANTLYGAIAGPGPGGKERVIGLDHELCACEPKR